MLSKLNLLTLPEVSVSFGFNGIKYCINYSLGELGINHHVKKHILI